MREVVFDSSFLIAIVERPTTWYEDIIEKIGKFEPVMLDCVIDEMKRISSSRLRKGRYSRLALELAKSFRVERCSKGSVDEQLVNYSKERNAIVATMDRTLIKKLKSLGLNVITLRSGRVEIR